MNRKMLALYGLKWNPFAPDVPVEALHVSRRIESSAGAPSSSSARAASPSSPVRPASASPSPCAFSPTGWRPGGM